MSQFMSDKSDPLEKFFTDASPEQMASDPILQQAFTVALLASDLFVPVEETEDQQKEAGGVSLMALSIEGQPHIMIFSSEARLREFMTAGTRFARASGNSILPSLQGQYAILNPGPDGRVMTPGDIGKITQQPIDYEAPGHVHGPGCQH